MLTATTLRCVSAQPEQPLAWELQLSHLLLVQQRGSALQLLTLCAHDGPDAVHTRNLALNAEDDAARLHELLRLAGLNARGAVQPPISPRPLVRATIFELLG